MTNNSVLRVGVVGLGYWGSKHARVMSGLDEVDQVVLIDSNPARVAAASRATRGAIGFATLEEALPHIDAVVIATPPSTHVPLALRAIEAGKHVLVEKPLATEASGAVQVIEAAAAAGVTLMTGHTFEYNSAVWKMRELLDTGELGEIYYIDTARLNLGLYQSDVNVILDLAPHDISIINYLVRSEPTSVAAWGERHANARFEDVAYLRLYYDDLGVTANVHVSWLDPCKVRRVTMVGSRKMAVWNDLASEERVRIYDKGVTHPGAHQLSSTPMTYRYGDIQSPYLDFDEPLAVEDRHFALCVQTGLRPQSDGVVGLAAVRVLECAQLSLQQDRRVPLAEASGSHLMSGVSPWQRERRAALVPQQESS